MPASRKAWNRAGRNGPKGDPPGGGLKGEKAIDQQKHSGKIRR